MPDFTNEFLKSKGEPITHKGQVLVLSHKFPVKNGDVLAISIEKANRDCRQGLCIDITGSCEMNGKTYKAGKGIRMLFWEDTSPKQIKLTVQTEKGFVWVENIWEKTNIEAIATPSGEKSIRESKYVESRYYGSAMMIEPIENGFRYRCNDWRPDENFDDIIFTIQRINN